MKLFRSNPRWSSSFGFFRGTLKRQLQQSSRQSAFTMIEIAISLAVIGFALVAIIGVLPAGLNVQQQNREETIINQDATIFVNAIRNGDRGLDDLTNYVVSITNEVRYYTVDTSGPTWKTNSAGGGINWYTFANSSRGTAYRLINGARIVGLLSKPKYYSTQSGFESNSVVASFRAISGAASEKYPQRDANFLNLAFAYRLVPEITPVPVSDTDASTPILNANLQELRLRFSWPLLPNGLIGNGRRTFRTTVGGSFERLDDGVLTNLYFLQNNTYVTAP
jgi:type II secretory pathway pseudopilin PulG